MKKGYLMFLGSFVVILLIVALIIYRRGAFVQHGIEIDKGEYPITGIDVSAHTGNIDFKKLMNQKIDFIYVKATEGEDFVDPKFEMNYSNAVNILPIGFYHFFRFNKSGKIQANNFLNNIRDKKTNLPLVIDVEEWGNIAPKLTDDVIDEIKIFITLVEKVSGKRIMIYSNESSYKKYIMGHFDKYDIWICSFSRNPNMNKKWTLWQHSHKGKLDGADGWVDINTFNGTTDEWNKYLMQETRKESY
jgi:lysozyme